MTHVNVWDFLHFSRLFQIGVTYLIELPAEIPDKWGSLKKARLDVQ